MQLQTVRPLIANRNGGVPDLNLAGNAIARTGHKRCGLIPASAWELKLAPHFLTLTTLESSASKHLRPTYIT